MGLLAKSTKCSSKFENLFSIRKISTLFPLGVNGKGRSSGRKSVAMSRVGSRPSWMVGESASAEPAMQQNEIDEQAARQREMLAAKREENIRRCSPS